MDSWLSKIQKTSWEEILIADLSGGNKNK